jgi:Tfp pilus assembly protein PilO
MEALIKQLEPRSAIMLMIAAVLLVATALGTWVIWPEVKEYRGSLNSRNTLEQLAGSGIDLDAQIAVVREQVESLGHELHGDLADMPDNQMEAFIVGRLQNISWRNDVELQSVKPGKGNIVKVFEEIVFNVEITGDYFDLYAWLQDLGEELGFIVVKQFSISPLGTDKTAPRLRADLTIVSYREVENV